MDAIAGHPKAIRIAGRRMSQSNAGPLKSPNAAKGPAPSTSPDDATGDAMHMRPPTSTESDYPRPMAAAGANEGQTTAPPHPERDDDDAGGNDDDGGANRRKRREEQRRKGMSNDEARLRRLEAPAVPSAKARGARRMSASQGMRISQPAGKVMP